MAGLTHAHVDAATGSAFPDTQGATWATPLTWAGFAYWDANPYTTIEYEHEIDAGKLVALSPVVSVSAECDSYLVTESHSDDGTTWTPYAAVGGLFVARHVRVRVAATGDYPILNDVGISLATERREQVLDNLDTASLTGSYRLGVGDIRLPATGYTVITHVSIAFNGLDASYRYEVIDKDPVAGPRIKIYDTTTWAHQPADCVIDAIILGA